MASVNQQALIEAVIEGKSNEVERLLQEGADVRGKTPGGMTPLHWAVVKGHFGIVKLLTERGADLKAKTASGMTPLDEAVIRGRLNVVKFFDEKGVNVVDEWNHFGDLPIHSASREGHLALVKWLCEEKKVNVMVNNKKDDKRPLNIARQSYREKPNELQHKDVIHYLFELDETG